MIQRYVYGTMIETDTIPVKPEAEKEPLPGFTVDGKEQGRYPLDRNNKILLGDKDWSNTLMIRDGKASVTEADCPDKICVHHAPIGRRGENIVCLPHKLVVEVVSPDEDRDGLDGITR